MDSESVSRRVVVGVLGSGVLAAPVVARALDEDGTEGSPSSSAGLAARDPATILYPLTSGARVGRWTVEAIEPLSGGAMTVALRSDDAPDHVFHLEVLARDGSPLAQRPPAESQHFAVFVRNGGDGWMPTEEEQGLAAMTIGKVIERNEQEGDSARFLTLAARLRPATASA